MIKIGTHDSIIEEQFKKWYGKEFKLEPKMRYEHYIGKTKIEIIFTQDEKVIWFTKFKGKFYGNTLSGVVATDPFTMVDIYNNLIENARLTLADLKKK